MKSNGSARRQTSIVLLGALLLVLCSATILLPKEFASPSAPVALPSPEQSAGAEPVRTKTSSQSSKRSQSRYQGGDGSLQIITDNIRDDHDGGTFCPLKHTDVSAEISGFISRVTVTQEFTNPSPDKVEAIYVFPLPHDAAVDDMTLQVGGRTIRGLIKRREEAQQIYQNAKNAGHTAALLDQERPNIFTQAVANIPPGAAVKVKITYVEVLKYEAGVYEFVYPMVVGPRYIPGNAQGKQAGGWSHDTDQVPDASRITPPVAGVHSGMRGSRAGHDISLQVNLDAGVTIRELRSITHDVDVQNHSAHSASVRLRSENEIPNRDFVLKYNVAGGRIEDALLTHADGRERDSHGGGDYAGDSSPSRGFFSFILQPPDRVSDEDATPRELIFVLDTSGSMNGFPLEMAKKTMKRAIENMRPGDTFNFITFAGDTHVLFPQPVTASTSNIRQAIAFMEGQRGGGGTEMMKAIRTALGESFDEPRCKPWQDCTVRPRPQSSLRVVCFMTDGYVGNDMEIVAEVKKHPDARVFSFGIGTAVNRFLLDKMAEAGRGEAEFVTRPEDAVTAADRFYERVHTPVLTDISIDWNGLPVSEVMPARPLDLFTAKPLVLTGRYQYPASGVIRLRGRRAGRAFEREIKVTLPGQENANQALAQLWARAKIHDLMSQDWSGAQSGTMRDGLKEQITQLGLDYRLMTQFTSFVAVEEQTVVEGGRSRTIQVPVEMPHGVNPGTVFGTEGEASSVNVTSSNLAMYAPQKMRSGTGQAAGVGGGALGGVLPSASPELSAKQSTDKVDAGRADDFSVKDERKELRKKMESTLHTSLMAVYECWVKAGRSASAKCAGLENGKVKVQVFLQSSSASLMKQLRDQGFVPMPVARPAVANQVSGTLAIDKLEMIANIPGVRLIALQK